MYFFFGPRLKLSEICYLGNPHLPLLSLAEQWARRGDADFSRSSRGPGLRALVACACKRAEPDANDGNLRSVGRSVRVSASRSSVGRSVGPSVGRPAGQCRSLVGPSSTHQSPRPSPQLDSIARLVDGSVQGLEDEFFDEITSCMDQAPNLVESHDAAWAGFGE